MKNSKVISAVVGGVLGSVFSGMAVGKRCNQAVNVAKDKKRKMDSYYFLFNQWLIVRQSGKTLAEYFEKNNYRTVAIYGMKEFGERLYDELRASDITVKYIIDKDAETIYADVDIVTPEETMEPVDVIVVTATYYFDEIEEMLCEKVDCPVVSLEDVLYEV